MKHKSSASPMFDYKSIFEDIEKTLIDAGSQNLPKEKIIDNLNWFKNLHKISLTDDDYYWILVYVIFYSGFKAATVTAKLDPIRKNFPNYETVANYDNAQVIKILSDPEIIRNKRKIKSCVDNARVFRDIVKSHGSFQEYIDSFEPNESFENLMLLKEELEFKFSGLGRVTAYHFLTDIGLPVLKPDRVIGRIFNRLGLIDSPHLLLRTVVEGRKFSHITGHPIRYIDIVFVVYGQVKSEEFGIERGICLERNPSCKICGVKNRCNYYKLNFAKR